MPREDVVRQQPDDLTGLADHDLGIEWQHAGDFDAQLRAADWPTDDKGSRRADVNGTQVLQSLGKRRWSEGSVPPNVEAPRRTTSASECPPFQYRTLPGFCSALGPPPPGLRAVRLVIFGKRPAQRGLLVRNNEHMGEQKKHSEVSEKGE